MVPWSGVFGAFVYILLTCISFLEGLANIGNNFYCVLTNLIMRSIFTNYMGKLRTKSKNTHGALAPH